MVRYLRNLLRPYVHEVAICCIVKNEHLYLQEWVDYHLKMGVSHFYIYDNESVIPVTDTLNEYINTGTVEVELIKGEKQQMPVYAGCLKQHGTKCQWIAFIDADEFIVPKKTGGNLPQFLTEYKKYGGLGIHWLVFGSNNNIERPQLSQLHSFTRRSLKTDPVNNHIKSIVQPKYVKRVLGPHHFKYKLGKYCVNENFERIDDAVYKHTSDKIQINHYFLRSLDEFKLKRARGRADNGAIRDMSEFYDLDKNANLIIDESILELQMIAEESASGR